MADVKLKVGDTLLVNGVYRDSEGNPHNIAAAGIDITSVVSTPDGHTKYPLEVIVKDHATTPGGYQIRASTNNWKPATRLLWDVRFRQGSRSFSTRTYTIELEAPIS